MKRLWIAPVAVLLTGCGSEESGVSEVEAPSSCDIASQNQFVYDVMKDSYLWSDQVPDLDPQDFESPEALLTEIRDTVPRDRWSYITDAATYSARYDEGTYEGYGVTYRYEPDASSVVVLYTYDDSGAGRAGLKRTDKILSFNGEPTETMTRAEVSNVFDNNDELELVVADTDNNEREITISRGLVKMNTVLDSRVIDIDGVNYGYLAFQSFLDTSIPELTATFDQFDENNADEIILDLRYNSGGRIDTAVHLASLIGGENVEGEVFGQRIHNEKYSSRNSSRNFDSTSGIGYDTVTIITSPTTCSASELVINSLSPHVNVQIVGGETCGKPVGMYGAEFCDKLIQPIEFITANSDGFRDYFDGFAPQCNATDDASKVLGDVTESMLNTAITFTRTGQCPSVDASPVNALPPGKVIEEDGAKKLNSLM